MPGPQLGDESTTINLKDVATFPDPVAVLNLRDCTAFRALDDYDQPVLVITDGVTTIAFQCGLRGLSSDLAQAAGLLAERVMDYCLSVRAAAHIAKTTSATGQ